MRALAERIRTPILGPLLGLLGLGIGIFIARAPLPIVGLVIGAVVLVVATLAEPLLGVGAALLVGPLRAWLEIVRPGATPHAGQVVLLLAVMSWIASGMLTRRTRVTIPKVFGPLLVFLMVGLLSLWRPVDVWASALEFLKWAQVLLVAVLVYDRLVQGAVSGWAPIVLLMLSGTFQAAVGLWQFGVRGDGVAQFSIGDGLYRAYGTFQQPNPFAGLLGLTGALLAGIGVTVFVDGWRTGERWRALVVAGLVAAPTGLIVAGLLASWSRGGWMGFGVAGLALLFLLPRRPRYGVVLVLVLAVVVVGLYVTGRLPTSLTRRLTSFTAYVRFEDARGVGITDENFAVVERMAHWQAALEMWRSRFWGGVGLGGYEAAYSIYALINWSLPLGHAHNFYLNMGAEVGLPGLLAYLGWLGSMVGAAVWAAQRGSGWVRGVGVGLAGAWTHLAVHSLVDNLLVNNVHLHVGVLVGLTAWVVLAVRAPAPTALTADRRVQAVLKARLILGRFG